MNLLDPQQPHKQLLHVRLGAVGGCASNQMGSSEPKTPGEQTRAMGSGWQMWRSHHGQPPALRPPPHWPSSSGSLGPEAGGGTWAPHTCEEQGRTPPELLLPPPDPWLLSGNDDRPLLFWPLSPTQGAGGAVSFFFSFKKFYFLLNYNK